MVMFIYVTQRSLRAVADFLVGTSSSVVLQAQNTPISQSVPSIQEQWYVNFELTLPIGSENESQDIVWG